MIQSLDEKGRGIKTCHLNLPLLQIRQKSHSHFRIFWPILYFEPNMDNQIWKPAIETIIISVRSQGTLKSVQLVFLLQKVGAVHVEAGTA